MQNVSGESESGPVKVQLPIWQTVSNQLFMSLPGKCSTDLITHQASLSAQMQEMINSTSGIVRSQPQLVNLNAEDM